MFQLLLAIIYLAFISLGLPDSLLGSAWPTIYQELNVPVSWSGIVFMIIAIGTVISSLQSDRLTRKLGPGKVTLISVAMTAAALFGFSTCHSFIMLCLWAIPYGLGAGSVDAALNKYVALHFASRHMSWLHCMWGIGASVGPYIMGAALMGGKTWNQGYRVIGIMQTVLVLILFISLPLWKKVASNSEGNEAPERKTPLSLKEIFSLPGAKYAMLCFFAYCALEQTTGLWTSSYLVLSKGIDAGTAARFASLFFIGITVGRAINGFLSIRLSDEQMVRLGQILTLLGILCILLPLGTRIALAGFVIIGLGCAPVFPSLLHATPDHFGAANSQAIMGVQMACAYIGTSIMPPIFGWIAGHISIRLLPLYLMLLLVLMFLMHEMLVKATNKNVNKNK